jgi:glycerol-3-phosphate dehydrogenase
VREAVTGGQAESLEDVLDRRLHALNRREAGFDTVVRAVADTMMKQRGGSAESGEAAVQSYLERRSREFARLKGESHG